ncbi:MAG: hypothetical protein IT450_21890 [Phycisphaerales bacterium]|nr:hypothetical protein [Phycisphaerales bacterium]
MKKDQIIKLLAAVAMLGVAGYLAYGYLLAPNPKLAETADQLCYDCNDGFTVTQADLRAAHRAGEPIPCPKCSSKNTGLGYRCPACQKMCPPEGHAGLPRVCKHCKAAFPPPKYPGEP